MGKSVGLTSHSSETHLSLLKATSHDLRHGLDRNRFTSVDLVKTYIARIKEVNSKLGCVLEINPDALSIAAELDMEKAKGVLRGYPSAEHTELNRALLKISRPLHGLPVLVKGNIGTLDKMQTNAGSFALQNSVLPADSTIAAKLRKAGCVLLGKASLTEWSMFRSSNSSSWNAILGQAYGAYFDKQCPGGSSSGSAIAADLGLCWATVGTETSGSIIVPSSRNNVVGIKPTVGLTSRHLIVPITEHQDSPGPMTRTVRDAAALLQVIAGSDPNDTYTSASPFSNNVPDYVSACKSTGLRGKRIGVARNVLEARKEELVHVIDAFKNALSIMAAAGAIIVEDTNFTAYEELKARPYNPVSRADFATNLPQYLNQLEVNPHNIRTLDDLRTFIHKHPKEEYPARNTANWDTALENGITNTSKEFRILYEKNLFLGGEGGIEGALERHMLDAVVLPSPISATAPALVGTPVITVPLGAAGDNTPIKPGPHGWDVIETAPGLPFGISFLGRKWSEMALIEMAYAFEQKTLVRDSLKRFIEPTLEMPDVISAS